jgi:hypothetical protein
MTEEDYYAIIARFGLKKTRFQETFVTSGGEAYSVPLARDQTPEQRIATIERIRAAMGISWRL